MAKAGGNLLGEVTGSQAPEYRLLDHEGSLVATTDSSGGVMGMDGWKFYAATPFD